ncbi:MAG: hypothetical protein KAQ75_05095, partial [Bacteroidales bacterium]|nr:hypothetical protein [Bacteroidales bacterium]
MKNIYQALKVLIRLILILTLVFSCLVANSQNIAITDDDTYTVDPSAMLDVKSATKGLLIPRLDSTQRNAISGPAVGLLVYDTDNSGFFYFDGTDWLTISQMNTSGTGSALFAVLNTNEDTVFAVYEDGARVIVPIGAKGSVGGFAVSGRSPSKAGSDEAYLHVTPDSTRITFETGAKGKVGGFAVSGRSPSKAGTSTTSLINLFPDNYFIGDSAGINTTTGKYNSFFGYKSGKNNTGGYRNIFIGYLSGYNNLNSDDNLFLGNEAGYTNSSGENNIFMGNSSGFSNESGDNN